MSAAVANLAAGRSRLEALILAGGAGVRFGGGKLLASYRGEPLICGAVRSALAAPVRRAVLVTGHDGEAVARAATAFAARACPGAVLDVVHAEDHAEGMAATLRTGIAALAADTDGVFVFLGDMPGIPSATARALADGVGDAAAAAPVLDGRRGHPVLFRRRLFPALTRLRGDAGARRLLDELGEGLACVSVADPGVLFDVDRPVDLIP